MLTVGYYDSLTITQNDSGLLGVVSDNYTFKTTDTISLTVFKSGLKTHKILEACAKGNSTKEVTIVVEKNKTYINTGSYLYNITINRIDGTRDTIVSNKEFNVVGGVNNEC